MPTRDGQLIPHGEHPEPRTRLQERLEGAQISRVYYLTEPGPTGSYGLALELTDGAKLIIFAGRDRYSQYSARLLFRWLERPTIVLPRMEKAFVQGRSGDAQADLPDSLQQQLEGLVIRGVIHRKEPTGTGGEALSIEFSNGHLLVLVAEVMDKMLADGERLLADIRWHFIREKTTPMIWFP